MPPRARTQTNPLKVIWEEHVAIAQLHNKVPNAFNSMPNIYPQSCPSPSTITTPSNTPIFQPTPLTTTPNTIRIQSTVLPQYIFRHNPSDGDATVTLERQDGNGN